jgi:N-acetylglutamate synthase
MVALMDLKALLPEIEAAAVRGWPALKAVTVEGWLWRHASGGSIRANSVAALTYSGTNLEASITRIEQLAHTHRVAACFTVSDASEPAGLDARLTARGYLRGSDHVTMAKSVDPLAALPASVALSAMPSAGWLNAYLSGLAIAKRPVAPAILERLPKSAVYIGALIDGRVISSGLSIQDGTVASVQCMATLPDSQRQGGAHRVLEAIEHIAARNSRTVLYLQTSADNHAARALYLRAGFEIVGRYHTRTKKV